MYGPIPVSFSFIFVLFSHQHHLHFQFQQYKLKKRRWWDWDLNPGPQDGSRRRNHGAQIFIRDCLLVPPLRPVNACLSMHGCLAHPAKRWYSTSSWTQNLKWKKWMARSFPPIWLTFNPNSWSLLWQENELTQSLGTSFTFQNFQPLSRL